MGTFNFELRPLEVKRSPRVALASKRGHILGARPVRRRRRTRPVLGPTEQQESTPEADTARGVADTAPVRSPEDKCSGSRSRSLSTPEQKKITARKRSGIPCLLSSALLEQDRPDASGTNHGARYCYLCQKNFFPLELEDNKLTRDFPRVLLPLMKQPVDW